MLVLIPPNQTLLEDFASRETGTEVGHVPPSEGARQSCHAGRVPRAGGDLKVALLSLLSQQPSWSSGAAP